MTRFRLPLLLTLVTSALLTACGGAKPPSTPAAALSPVAVTTVAATEQSWPLIYEATGTVRARTSAVIAARMMGYVREVRVREGDRVREGQILVTLDARDLDVSVTHAGAVLEEVRSAIPEADSAVAAAQAALDLAQSTFRRMQDLSAKRSITAQEFDEASAKLKSAQANLAMARARRAQLDVQAARVEQDVKASEVARSYAEIAAPFAGIVTAKPAEPGSMASPGAPLVTIERDGSYRLEVAVEESRLGNIHVGQNVSVVLDGVAQPVESRVAEIVPMIDAPSRSNVVKIDLPALAALRSGLFGRARFTLGTRSPLTIPAGAVRENGQLQSVLVAENGVARTRLVTLGERSGDRIEVLSGLVSGEKLIAPIPATLQDGAPVEVRPSEVRQ